MSENLWIIDPLDGTNNFSNDIPHFSISIAFAQRGKVQMGLIFDPCRKECFTAISGKGAYLNGQKINVSLKSDISHAMVATGFYYDRGEIMEKTLNTIHSLFIYKIRGIRRMGSAALDLAWTSCGRFDVYFEYFLSPWDFAAGMLILKEAGGICLDKFGNEISLDSEGIIATNKNLHKEMISYIKL
jgi:myo-inositol-1(or 4)-monophosphatase